MPLDVVLLSLRIVIALSLYLFLAVLVRTLWQDLRAAGQDLDREGKILPGRLVVVESEEAHVTVGSTFPLQSVTTLGRSPICTIVLPDSFASTAHAQMIWRRGQWWLEDLQSRNGTVVNTIPITGPVILSSGDELGIGRVKLRLEMD